MLHSQQHSVCIRLSYSSLFSHHHHYCQEEVHGIPLGVSLTCKDRRLHPDLLLSRGPGRPGAHLWQHGLVLLPFSGLLHIRVHTVDIPLLFCHPGRPVHLWRSPGSGATPHHCIHTRFHTLLTTSHPVSHTFSSFVPNFTHSKQLHTRFSHSQQLHTQCSHPIPHTLSKSTSNSTHSQQVHIQFHTLSAAPHPISPNLSNFTPSFTYSAGFTQSQQLHTQFYTLSAASHPVLYTLSSFTPTFTHSQQLHTQFHTLSAAAQCIRPSLTDGQPTQ